MKFSICYLNRTSVKQCVTYSESVIVKVLFIVIHQYIKVLLYLGPYHDAEIIRTFINQINVYAAEKVDRKRRQRIQINYNCIGEFQPPKYKETV